MLKKTMKLFTSITMSLLLIGSITVTAAEQPQSTDDVNQIDEMKELESVSFESVSEVVSSPSLIENIGNISVKERMQVENLNIPLYCTFDSQEQALENISDNSVVQLIKTIYGYEDISDTTWQEYYSAMYNLFESPDCPSWYDESNLDFRALRQFFDIYENKSKNDEIIARSYSVARASNILNSTDILELLPYDSYVTLSNQSKVLNNEIAVAANLGFNINNGITYATSYATSPNKSDYDYFSSGDCTNFVSQILENGGISQEVYSSEASGWWHTKSTILFITTHKHSISWIRADTFAKYMGVGYTTTSHSTFTNNIQKGDFIGADFGNDGDWNHMGFVTDKETTMSNGYYDYKVAQHTSNYHEWTSSSSNGWDTIESDGGKYGRVRR